ncbi:1225_t:CDS:2 [Acaulospora colombiana]|uniref:1225_t:CDS:1 n=1 Tax=Acaulospora colombiana TaxID=27376 RepID=A0ACA9MPK2_9GLOM|nr:1225_t:CDS:2 [Acaulospora colombiana]
MNGALRVSSDHETLAMGATGANDGVDVPEQVLFTLRLSSHQTTLATRPVRARNIVRGVGWDEYLGIYSTFGEIDLNLETDRPMDRPDTPHHVRTSVIAGVLLLIGNLAASGCVAKPVLSLGSDLRESSPEGLYTNLQFYPLLLALWATSLPVVKAQQGLIQNVTVSSADPRIQYTPTNEWFPAVVTSSVDGSTLSFMQSVVFNASVAFTITGESRIASINILTKFVIFSCLSCMRITLMIAR